MTQIYESMAIVTRSEDGICANVSWRRLGVPLRDPDTSRVRTGPGIREEVIGRKVACVLLGRCLRLAAPGNGRALCSKKPRPWRPHGQLLQDTLFQALLETRSEELQSTRPLRSARPPDCRAEEPVTTKELAELMLKGPATATAPGSELPSAAPFVLLV